MKRIILLILVGLNFNLLAQKKEIDQQFQKGTGMDGVRVGDWHYFDDHENLNLTYNYDSNTISYIKPDSSLYLVYYKDIWKAVIPERQLRYIGSYAHLYAFFAKELASTYSRKAGKKDISTIILLELEFNKEGRLIAKELIGEHKEYFEEAILKMAESIPEFWIPAIYQGNTVNSKIAFPIIYSNKTNKEEQPHIEDLKYEGKLMQPIKVIAHGY